MALTKTKGLTKIAWAQAQQNFGHNNRYNFVC